MTIVDAGEFRLIVIDSDHRHGPTNRHSFRFRKYGTKNVCNVEILTNRIWQQKSIMRLNVEAGSNSWYLNDALNMRNSIVVLSVIRDDSA